MSRTVPILRARTRRIDDPGELLRFAEPLDPRCVIRRGDGIVGVGSTHRIATHGAGRFADARTRWQDLVAEAELDDEVRLPGTGLVAFGAFTFAAASAASSVLDVPAWVIGRRDGVAWLTEISMADAAEPARAPEPIPWGVDAVTSLAPGMLDRSRHRAAVASAVARLRAGVLDKVVIARDAHGQIAPEADRRQIVRRLAAAYPETWTFAIDGLIGASPEMLVRVKQGQVAARVLAGTMPRGANAASDAAAHDALRDSAKNRYEHRLAIDSALAALAEMGGATDPGAGDPGAGLTTSPEPFLLALPNVWHLASDIRGALPAGTNVLGLVEALHPTAAVGGTPRDAALRLIRELEPFDRRRYAGPAGWVSAAGDGEWVVALRSAEVDADGRVTAFAGGGIVAESDPVDEYAETLPKLAPIVNALRG